jgi:hypothetical protein
MMRPLAEWLVEWTFVHLPKIVFTIVFIGCLVMLVLGPLHITEALR